MTLSCHERADFVFCSSTASVLGPSHPSLIPERLSTSASDADALGYSRSKWVAESICSRAYDTNGLGGQVKILRIGQLTGDTEKGIWNMSEAWPLMLSTVRELGCLPNLNEPLSWLPLNVAAKAVLEIAMPNGAEAARGQDGCPVFHLVNNSTSTTWRDLLSWLKSARSEPFDVVDPAVWLEKLEGLDNHPAKSLLGLWRKAYGHHQDPEAVQTVFGIEKARQGSLAMQNVKAVDQLLVQKIWSWLEGEMNER